jgi:hypothetical protein
MHGQGGGERGWAGGWRVLMGRGVASIDGQSMADPGSGGLMGRAVPRGEQGQHVLARVGRAGREAARSGSRAAWINAGRPSLQLRHHAGWPGPGPAVLRGNSRPALVSMGAPAGHTSSTRRHARPLSFSLPVRPSVRPSVAPRPPSPTLPSLSPPPSLSPSPSIHLSHPWYAIFAIHLSITL